MPVLPLGRRNRPPQNRPVRFMLEGLALARVFGGYKRITLMQRLRGFDWAERQRQKHNVWGANEIYTTAIKNQGLLIKTGQFLSSRPDILPDEYIDVLSRLQDELPPEPFDVIRREVERELGKPLDAVFQSFDPQPVAAASLAQVHRAVLHDGRVAAVKVQYPNIEKLVDADLKNIAVFVRILNRLDKTLDFRFIAEEMGNMIPRELDFINEGRNAEAIAANFAGVEDVIIPRIYWEYTTRRVLTMEYVEGIKVTDVEALRRAGIDTPDVAKQILVAFAEMMLHHGLFHADPHPGNLLVAPGPKLVLVDFGQVKDISPAFRFVFAQMTRALMTDNDSDLGRSFRDIGFRMKQDTDEGYVDLGKAYMGDISKEVLATDAGWVEPELFRRSYRDMMRILRSNPLIKVPPDLLFVGRVMGLLNGLSMTLRSRTNLLVQMARLMDEDEAARKNGNAPVVTRTSRRLLEA
jgi:predicted unusual protein kinase regulating ubiquinone biosynthesis (AarF/ABC1/UbiB family)